MRSIKELKELIGERPDEDIVFCPFFAKSEADEFAEEHLEAEPLTLEEWHTVTQRLNNDDGVWQELIQAWGYHIDKVISERKKGNDDSK